jgi:competence protein ComGC
LADTTAILMLLILVNLVKQKSPVTSKTLTIKH